VKNDSNKNTPESAAGALQSLGIAPLCATGNPAISSSDPLAIMENQLTWLNREFQKLRCQRAFISQKTFNLRARELRAWNAQLGADVGRYLES